MTELGHTISQEDESGIRALVGQLFIIGFHGTVPSDDIQTLIRKYKVGAVILFQRNIESASQLLELTRSLQSIAREAGHSRDLIIAIDQENGLVTRIKAPIAMQLPGPMALGATKDALNAYETAYATAEVLKSFGINMNYAPIADVNSEPKNPVIGVRSPSDNPDTVGKYVSEQIHGLTEGGVASCVKHFPGHGDTNIDSHYGLPDIAKTKAEIDACELVPFRRAVHEGVGAVMTAHIRMSGISQSAATNENAKLRDLPASLNPFALDILRQELKFKGLIVSDCLEMEGVRGPYGTEQAAIMALKAGTDCVMICHTMSAQVGAIERVVDAVKTGNLTKTAIEASVGRVNDLKSKFVPSIGLPLPSSTLSRFHLRNDLRNKRHEQLASSIYAKSTTVVRSSPSRFPLTLDGPEKIVFVSPAKAPHLSGVVESGEEKTRVPYTPIEYIDILRAQNGSIKHLQFHDESSISEVEIALDRADIVILATRNATLEPAQKMLGIKLGEKFGQKLIVVATCDPYDFLDEADEIQNYMTIYEPTIPAFHSAVNVMFGITAPSGTLPVGPGTKILVRSIKTASEKGIESDIDKVYSMWVEVFPDWPIERKPFSQTLARSNGFHYIHPQGFCLSFLLDGNHGRIAAIGVLPKYRGQGIGIALINAAHQRLRSETSTAGNLKSLGLGSVFPRFWPGVPLGVPLEYKDFFINRGYTKGAGPTARDLYQDISTYAPAFDVPKKAADLGITCKPWSHELEAECIKRQEGNFSSHIGWVQAYKKLAAENQHHEVMVAIDGSGAQVAWTLMCSSSATVIGDFMFLPIMASKGNTGLIACVGVDKEHRGKGIASLLLAEAILDMKKRGVTGVFIDWVTIRGLYEKLGFKPVFEYEDFTWGG